MGGMGTAEPGLPVPRALWSVLCAVFVLLLCILCAPASAREVYGVGAGELGLYLGNRFLAEWRVGRAREVADDLLARGPDDPAARNLEARVRFFEGRYAEALGLLGDEPTPFRSLVDATVESTRGFESKASAHFVVSWSGEKDGLLVDPALEALEAALVVAVRRLGFSPAEGERIRVEIYPSVSAFTAVSTLTREEVETSGTIGLCKFNRLMVTSPRATVWGYRWRDTLCHEFIHLAVYRLSRGTAPIWIHEGVAKMLEGAWRGREGGLSPSSQALLARRMEAGDLISLEAMSPSVAKLPSAEDTALAFAEVATMMTFLVERSGPDALRRLVEGLGAGQDDRGALEDVWGGTFDGFGAAWRAWVKTLPFTRKDVQVVALALVDEHSERPGDEPGTIPDPDAREFARLGDLLGARGRSVAASVEYAKAYEASPAAPGVGSRYAGSLLDARRPGEALRVADESLGLYPDLAVLWYRKAAALYALGRVADAAAASDAVFEINPFHLPARELAVAVARAMGDEAAAGRAEGVLSLLLGGAPSPKGSSTTKRQGHGFQP